ncbi:unnamed protein product [Brassica oleracea]
MYTCQISNKINLSKAITTSHILFDLLSDTMLFDLDMRYSLLMYISTLRLHALPLRLTISELRSLPNASSVLINLYAQSSSVPTFIVITFFSLVAIGFLTLLLLGQTIVIRKENLELSLLYATLTVTQIRFSGSVTLSGGQDWKATLRVPPLDTCYQTGAFCIPVLEKIDPNTNVTMILVPTHELALQTSQVCKELSKYLNIQVMVTTGGTSLRDDIKRLHQPVHLLVGTPGRILNLTTKGVCVLKDCTMFVMDEADKLLSAEFQALVSRVPGRLSS